MHLKFKANDFKGVQVMRKINLQYKSSSHKHSNVHIKLKVAAHRVYIRKALTQIRLSNVCLNGVFKNLYLGAHANSCAFKKSVR